MKNGNKMLMRGSLFINTITDDVTGIVNFRKQHQRNIGPQDLISQQPM